jgi:hypothetical protein
MNESLAIHYFQQFDLYAMLVFPLYKANLRSTSSTHIIYLCDPPSSTGMKLKNHPKIFRVVMKKIG